MAKGGGSSNKTACSGIESLLEEKALEAFLAEKVRALGVAACPPYGSPSSWANFARETMKTIKLASAGFLDSLPPRGRKSAPLSGIRNGKPGFQRSRKTRFGRAVRRTFLPMKRALSACPATPARARWGSEFPATPTVIAMGKITRDGFFLEILEKNPAPC
jgi:fumarate hydratase class I